jgi:tRNA dimethylallyltransferase
VSFSILSIVGPTASGKSELGIAVATALAEQGRPSQIINADAMQVYTGMDIGTAKLSAAERGEIKHHLIDVIAPSQEMTAVEYQQVSRVLSEELLAKGVTPIFVGGSMFYVSAALDNLDFAPTDSEVRNKYESMAEFLGNLSLHELLASKDPESAALIPAQNIRRVVRALEVIELTGLPYSSVLPEPQSWKPTLTLGIRVDRAIIRERIESRVSQMWDKGLLLEVRNLLGTQELSRTARMAIGYRQAISELEGALTTAEAQYETTVLTQRYARRQMSWFNRDKRTIWLDGSQNLFEQAMNQIRLES